MAVPEFSDTSSLLLATSAGAIKRLPLAAFAKRRKDGLAAINLAAGDEVCAGGGGLAVGCQCLLSVTHMVQALQWCCGLQPWLMHPPYRPPAGTGQTHSGYPNRPDVAAVILTATAPCHCLPAATVCEDGATALLASSAGRVLHMSTSVLRERGRTAGAIKVRRHGVCTLAWAAAGDVVECWSGWCATGRLAVEPGTFTCWVCSVLGCALIGAWLGPQVPAKYCNACGRTTGFALLISCVYLAAIPAYVC